MGRSPGQWIRMVLLGKKMSRRSGSPKSSGKGKECNWKEIPTLIAEALSQPESPTPAQTIGNVDLDPEVEAPSSSIVGEAVLLCETGDAGREGTASMPSGDSEDFEREKAAVMIQAACRGYLARRALHALKGIIRLQAVVRGYLVRRQAVVTLYSILGIVQLQMLARGRKSPLAKEVHRLLHKHRVVGKVYSHSSFHKDKKSMKRKFPAQAFIYKLLSTTPVVMPIRRQYFNEEDNSAWNWLERWSYSHVWEPLSEPKKPNVLRSHAQHATCSVRRQNPAEVGFPSASVFTDLNKKHSPKRFTGTLVHENQEKLHRKVIKVKQNVRQIPNLSSHASGQADTRTEQPKNCVRRVLKPEEDIEPIEHAYKLPEYVNVLTKNDNNGLEDALKCMSHAAQTTDDIVLTRESKAASVGIRSKCEPDIGVTEHVEETRNYVDLPLTEINVKDKGSECGPNIGMKDTAGETTDLVATLATEANAIFGNCSKNVTDITTENALGGMVCGPQQHPSNQSSRPMNSMVETDKKKPPVKKFTTSSAKVVQENPPSKQIKATKKLTKASNSGAQAFSQAGLRTGQLKHGVSKLSGSATDKGVTCFVKQTTKSDVVFVTEATSVLEDCPKPEPHHGATDSCQITGNGVVLVSDVNASLGCDPRCEPDVRPKDSGDGMTEGVSILVTVASAISADNLKCDTEITSNSSLALNLSDVNVAIETPNFDISEGGPPPSQGFTVHEKKSNEVQICHENQKVNKRRELLVSAKPSQHETTVSQKHPSYTAATPVKAKKSPDQGSQDSSNNGCDRDGLKGRFSQPSNRGKPNMHQVQRPVRKSTKGGPSEKLVQAEWKR